MNTEILFSIIILVVSIIIHEVAHGYAALRMGDVTAKYAGRLTMNPIKHIDPVGSIFLPLLLVVTGSPFLIGWAKPVPYNPYNLRNLRWGEFTVAIAGPLSNIAIAVMTMIFLRVYIMGVPEISLELLKMGGAVISINFFLAFFNLIPIPPLDGSKVLFNLFPSQTIGLRVFLEKYKFVIIILFIWQFSGPFINLISNFANTLFLFSVGM